MWYALWYIAMGCIAVVAAIMGEDISPSTIDYLNHTYTVTNLMLAAGIIGICSRLDKLVEAQKKVLKGGGV